MKKIICLFALVFSMSSYAEISCKDFYAANGDNNFVHENFYEKTVVSYGLTCSNTSCGERTLRLATCEQIATISFEAKELGFKLGIELDENYKSLPEKMKILIDILQPDYLFRKF